MDGEISVLIAASSADKRVDEDPSVWILAASLIAPRPLDLGRN